MRALIRGAWIGATVVLAAGCGAAAQATGTHGDSHTKSGAVVAPSGHRLSKLSTPGTPKGEQTVKLEVVATSSKPTRHALALVPVFIDGHGPLPFALDTGASRSLISASLARRHSCPAALDDRRGRLGQPDTAAERPPRTGGITRV